MSIYGLEYIREVYFNNNKDVIKLENIFSKFRKRCFDEQGIVQKFNTFEELIEFNRQAEKAFGFKLFSLSIDSSLVSNAYTIPLSYNLDVVASNKFSPKSNGMKYGKDAEYVCIVVLTCGILYNTKLSDKEVFAILMHEIGHNFSYNFSKSTAILTNVHKIIMLRNIAIGSLCTIINPLFAIPTSVGIASNLNSVKKYIYKIRENMTQQNKNIFIITDTIGYISSYMSYILSKIEFIRLIMKPAKYLAVLYLKIINIINKGPLVFYFNMMGYNDEKVSDNFATMYGYGEELSSGLSKMTYRSKSTMYKYKPTAFIAQLLNLTTMPLEILYSNIGPHPDLVMRMSSQIKYLEKELQEEDLDPKIKKEISSQIKNINKMIENDILNPVENMDIKDPDLLSKMYSYLIYDILGGDLKQIMFKEDNYTDIKNVYLRKLEDVKLK